MNQIYEVGIMSDKIQVEAPTPESAVLYYGLHTNGNMKHMGVIYSMDGKDYEGDRMPLLSAWGLDGKGFMSMPDDAKDKLRDELSLCKFVGEVSP